jgi:hypothetical protein
MTPRNLFNIILKIFGLFFFKEIVYLLPQIIVFVQPNKYTETNGNDTLSSLLISFGVIAFYVFFIYQLLFKTNNIVDKLKLDKGFNREEFSFDIPSSHVLTIALIVVGGVIVINEIPNLCRNIFFYFQEKSVSRNIAKPSYSYIIVSAVKILLALLIMGERKRIVEFAEKNVKTKQSETK